jgi:hypothetical protein
MDEQQIQTLAECKAHIDNLTRWQETQNGSLVKIAGHLERMDNHLTNIDKKLLVDDAERLKTCPMLPILDQRLADLRNDITRPLRWGWNLLGWAAAAVMFVISIANGWSALAHNFVK